MLPLLVLAWLVQALAPIGAALAMARINPLADAIICVYGDDAGDVAPLKAPTPVKMHADCLLCQIAHADFAAGADPQPSVVSQWRAYETAEWVVASSYRPPHAFNDQSRPRAPPARG